MDSTAFYSGRALSSSILYPFLLPSLLSFLSPHLPSFLLPFHPLFPPLPLKAAYRRSGSAMSSPVGSGAKPQATSNFDAIYLHEETPLAASNCDIFVWLV